jgi:predicted secreted Zn-dependent protease
MEHPDNLRWRKASYSDNGGECVEVSSTPGTMLVRDTKQHGSGPVHQFTARQWNAFVAELKADEPARLL